MPKTRQHKAPPTRIPDQSSPSAVELAAIPEGKTLAMLAHELKTPLSAIAAAAEIMRSEEFGAIENEKYRTYIADIRETALLSLAVIDRMLADRAGGPDLSNLDQNLSQTQFQTTTIDADALAASVCSSMQPLARTAGVELVTEAPAPGDVATTSIFADRVSVTQILFNLVNNAIKFTPSGGRVELRTEVQENGSFAIVVSDSGSGMTKGQINRANSGETVPYSRRQPAGRGQGFGLPIVHALCKANGAQISLSNSKGATGTTAQVTFPPDRHARA